jgi:predicted flap endonuclease-1-like 5' DNA nuclease
VNTRRLPPDRFSTEFPATIGKPANAALVARGVTTLAQLASMTERELLAVHGVGPKAVRILRDTLAQHGLAFRVEPKSTP